MFIDLSPLKSPNFRRLFLGQLISAFGSQMTAVIIPFQVYFLTESVLWTGLISGVEFIFLFVSSLIGGVLADRFDKKRVLILAEAVLCLIPLGLALNAAMETPNLTVIFLLAGFASFMNGIHRPALEALTPRLVKPEDLAKVSALAPTRHILTTILSPLIGGVLIVSIGAAYTYVLDAVSFLISLCFLMGINYQGVHEGPAHRATLRSFFNELIEGKRFIQSRPDIFGSYAVDFIAMVFCNPVALFPALATAFDRVDALGMLYALPSTGALMMTVFSRWTLDVRRCGVFIIVAASCWAISMFWVGMAPEFNWLLFGLLCAGYFDMMSGIFRMTIWNETIPENVRGRMAGFEMLSYMSGPLLGNAILGFFADYYGIQVTLAAGAVFALVGLLLFNLWRPQLWHFVRTPSL
ncbi:MAG TPA: MFS transporter [Parachlamydiaceae bacterium]|nr:MFS transporter [Parachlamydiaceae bacterium]